MNDLFESLRDYGVSQKDALCYALWLERQSPKLPIRLEHWLPTPLPLGYLGKDNRLVRLPFLDLNHKEQVFGIMVGDMCLDIRLLGRNCGGNMLQMGFISVNSELTCLHNKMYVSAAQKCGNTHLGLRKRLCARPVRADSQPNAAGLYV
jgi:hypothetical protein